MTQRNSVVTHYKTPLYTLEKKHSLVRGMVQNVNHTSPVKLDDFKTRAKRSTCNEYKNSSD